MDAYRAGREAMGVVAFARGPVPGWVVPVFTLNRQTHRSADAAHLSGVR